MAAGGLKSQDWPAQLEGLERKLRASKAGWKIVVGHHPPRSNGHHGNTVELLEALEPILQVDLPLRHTQASTTVSPPKIPPCSASARYCRDIAVQGGTLLVSLAQIKPILTACLTVGDWSASLFCRS